MDGLLNKYMRHASSVENMCVLGVCVEVYVRVLFVVYNQEKHLLAYRLRSY